MSTAASMADAFLEQRSDFASTCLSLSKPPRSLTLSISSPSLCSLLHSFISIPVIADRSLRSLLIARR